MKRVIGLLLFLVLSGVDTTDGVGEYHTFLPLVVGPEPKAGVVWLDTEPADVNILHFEWWYDYSLRGRDVPGVEFVPFFWCDKWPPHAYGRKSQDYFELAERHLTPDYNSYLLFLNEPDLTGDDTGGQCDMEPRRAAYLYKAIREQLPHAKLVGPAVSHRDYWSNWLWLRTWYGLIDEMGLRPPEVAAIHTYMSENPQWIVDSLFTMLAEFPGSPGTVWVTEFGNCDPAVVQWMLDTWQADGRVSRYAYFTVRDFEPHCENLFYNTPGYSLTPAGRVWVKEHPR
jgi:hypothetical protein